MQKEAMVRVNVRIPKRFLRAAKKLAREETVTVSHFIRRTLAREFAAKEDRKGA